MSDKVLVYKSDLVAIADAIRIATQGYPYSTSPNERVTENGDITLDGNGDIMLAGNEDFIVDDEYYAQTGAYLVFPNDFISNIEMHMRLLWFDGEDATIVLTDIERMIDESGLIEDTEIDVGELGGGTIVV